eukprot:CAMPEP_0172036864 /NCGR_PEP_ID=MMETSP1041-20130122/22405_1 /TAXON_ID=464988 /ORGANISM="Hemiselmis andersenii, Strain CCMP439" /LENGTH=79 /DNA_ID=CAMNT_0012694149 /DNA_START=298 /DNA_END=534 /DNA_ORIENTATION=-
MNSPSSAPASPSTHATVRSLMRSATTLWFCTSLTNSSPSSLRTTPGGAPVSASDWPSPSALAGAPERGPSQPPKSTAQA